MLHHQNGTTTTDRPPYGTGLPTPGPGPAQVAPAAPPLLVDVRGAADLLAVSERTVFRLVRSGELPTVAIPGVRALRFSRRDLEAWVQRHTVAGARQAGDADPETREGGPAAAPSQKPTATGSI